MNMSFLLQGNELNLMFRVFSRISGGLLSMAIAFQQVSYTSHYANDIYFFVKISDLNMLLLYTAAY